MKPTAAPSLIADVGAIAVDIHDGRAHQEIGDDQIVIVEYRPRHRHYTAHCTRYAPCAQHADPETGHRDYCEIEEDYAAASLLALAQQIQIDGWI